MKIKSALKDKKTQPAFVSIFTFNLEIYSRVLFSATKCPWSDGQSLPVSPDHPWPRTCQPVTLEWKEMQHSDELNSGSLCFVFLLECFPLTLELIGSLHFFLLLHTSVLLHRDWGLGAAVELWKLIRGKWTHTPLNTAQRNRAVAVIHRLWAGDPSPVSF